MDFASALKSRGLLERLGYLKDGRNGGGLEPKAARKCFT
jgi:hypothetical protein